LVSIVPLRIENESAKIDAVKMGKRLKTIDKIVLKKMINRCQASLLKPSGMGIIHKESAMKKMKRDRKVLICSGFIIISLKCFVGIIA